MNTKIIKKLNELFQALEKTEIPCSCPQCDRLLDLREKHLLLMHTIIDYFYHSFGNLDDTDLRLIFSCGGPEEPAAPNTLH